jgi:hypothetical protein
MSGMLAPVHDPAAPHRARLAGQRVHEAADELRARRRAGTAVLEVA